MNPTAFWALLKEAGSQWVVTSLLFSIGKLLIGLYLGYTAVASSFGAASSLAALLIWLYYSAQIFLFGAELTKAYATRHRSLS